MAVPRSRHEVAVYREGERVVVRRQDGADLPAWIIPNERDTGYWVVFRGPHADQVSEALSAGFASLEEALSAAKSWVSLGIRRLPRNEAKGVHLDEAGSWCITGLETMWPLAASTLVTIEHVERHESAAIVLSDRELSRVRRTSDQGGRARVSFPARRLIPDLEALNLRRDISIAQLEQVFR